MNGLSTQIDLAEVASVEAIAPNSIQKAEQLLARRSSPESRSVRGQLYDFQKIIGDRTETGALKLKELKPRHKQVIALHLQGISSNDIARSVGYDAAWVCTVLADPLVQPYLDKFNEMVDRELMALKPKAVEVVRDGMESTSERIRLAASDKVFKATGMFGDVKARDESAGEVIKAALASMAQLAENVVVRTVTANERAVMIDITSEDLG